MLLCGFGVISIQCVMPCVLCDFVVRASVAETVQIKQTDFSISLPLSIEQEACFNNNHLGDARCDHDGLVMDGGEGNQLLRRKSIRAKQSVQQENNPSNKTLQLGRTHAR